jgi:hypothetical protein
MHFCYKKVWNMNLTKGLWHRSSWMQLTLFTLSIGYNQKLPWHSLHICRFWNHITIIVNWLNQMLNHMQVYSIMFCLSNNRVFLWPPCNPTMKLLWNPHMTTIQPLECGEGLILMWFWKTWFLNISNLLSLQLLLF